MGDWRLAMIRATDMFDLPLIRGPAVTLYAGSVTGQSLRVDRDHKSADPNRGLTSSLVVMLGVETRGTMFCDDGILPCYA